MAPKLRGYLWFHFYRLRHRIEVSDAPHFDEASLRLFSRLITQARTYVEFGTGGSTVVASKHPCKIVSVESDGGFLRAVKRKVGPRPDFIPIRACIGPTVDWGIPLFDSQRGAIKRRIWSRYPLAPWRHVSTADLVLVDGRFRVACVLQAVLHGCQTILVDDYSVRPHYQAIERFAELETMSGRMAVFHPKKNVHTECEEACNSYYLDWR